MRVNVCMREGMGRESDATLLPLVNCGRRLSGRATGREGEKERVGEVRKNDQEDDLF